MLKLTGALLIIFAATMVGFYQAAQFAKRPRQIRHVVQALKRLETEILYGFTPLPDALHKISKQLASPLAEMFKQAADQLADQHGKTTMESWQDAITQHWKRTAMKPTEEDIIRQLGTTLGITDREDQIKHLHLAMTQLQSEAETAKDEQMRYEKMCKSLGALTGVLVVILMY